MKKMMVWVVLTTIFTIAALSLIVINYLQSTVECWWTYPVMSIIFAWVYTTITVFLIRKRWIASSGWIISTIIFLAILNQLNAGSGWFWPLAFPLTILSGSVLMGIVAAITHARSVSFILAIILAESAIECIGIDYIINRFLGHLHIGWSLIALTIIIPVEILLLFYYSYLRKHIDLRRYFHV